MQPARHTWTGIGASLGALAVVLGAFGAHALEEKLDPEQLEWWHTAVLYHALHALALVTWSVFRDRRGGTGFAGWCFALGVALFSGTLYAMALGAPRWFGAITPLGGTLLIAGWVTFAVQGFRGTR